MPKGKKLCPSCGAEHGARKRECECGHKFGKVTKQEGQKVKQTKHPLGQKYVPEPGLWVFDLERGMPAIHAPDPLPSGPLSNQVVYDHCAYNGYGDTLYEYIPARRIADPKLRKLWEKAQKAMREAWRYLTDESESTRRESTDAPTSQEARAQDSDTSARPTEET